MPTDVQSPSQSPTAQGWLGEYQYRDNLSQSATDPALREHYRQEMLVMQPTLTALGVDVKNPSGPVVDLQSPPPGPPPTTPPGPPPTTGPPSPDYPPPTQTPENKPPVSPTQVDDSQGHTVGHIEATDPSKYDEFIKEACDYYGNLYHIKIDPNLIKAHIWQESKGDPFALSQDGQLSRGLMQVSNSPSVPTADILSRIKNPDGSDDPNIPLGGGNQYDPRTSIFTGVKYDALAMSGEMGTQLKKSGLPPTELGVFPDQPLSQVDAMRAYQGGPGVLLNPSPASDLYSRQLTGLKAQFEQGKAPSDPGYTNPAGGPGWKEPKYGAIV